LRQRDNVEPVETALIRSLLELAENRLSEEALGAEIDAEVLALLAEEGLDTTLEAAIQNTLEESLTNIQATRRHLSMNSLRRVFVNVAKRVTTNVPDPEVRAVFSHTGLTSLSCLTIRDHVLANQDTVRKLLTEGGPERLPQFIDLLLPLVSSLSEMQSNHEYGGSYNALLSQWLEGASISSVTGDVSPDPESLEALANVIDDLFRYRLPWGMSSYLRIAMQVLALDRTDVPDFVRFLPSMVKFGLPNPTACWAMSIGIPFRRTAIEVAAAFHRDVPTQGFDRFREWLSTLSSERLRREFGLTGPTLEDVARAIFTAAVNPLLRQFADLETFLPLDVRVEGIRYENRDIVALQAAPGQQVDLVRDYDNRVDRNAISVRLLGRDMGYIPREVAQILAPEIDTGTQLGATVLSIESGSPPKVRIRIVNPSGSAGP